MKTRKNMTSFLDASFNGNTFKTIFIVVIFFSLYASLALEISYKSPYEGMLFALNFNYSFIMIFLIFYSFNVYIENFFWKNITNYILRYNTKKEISKKYTLYILFINTIFYIIFILLYSGISIFFNTYGFNKNDIFNIIIYFFEFGIFTISIQMLFHIIRTNKKKYLFYIITLLFIALSFFGIFYKIYINIINSNALYYVIILNIISLFIETMYFINKLSKIKEVKL